MTPTKSNKLNVSLCLCTSIKLFQALHCAHNSSPPALNCRLTAIKPNKGTCTGQHEIHLQYAGAEGLYRSHLLEQEFSALSLWGKAGDGPHFDLNASVELLVPHVPYSLDRCGYCFVLKIVMTAALLVLVTVKKKR